MLSSYPFFVAALKKIAAINAPKMYYLTKYDVLDRQIFHEMVSSILYRAI
ncbi:hypothetical protein ACW0Z7_002312 [Vibrio parahaemolyticus]